MSVLLLSAFAETCESLLPWADSPSALMMFVHGASNRTGKTTTYANHHMFHSKLAHLALHTCRDPAPPPFRVLEIGLGCRMRGPGGSVALWLAMLPAPIKVQLYIMEFDRPCAQKWQSEFGAHAARVSVHIGDQNSNDDLDRLYLEAGARPFDIIIDDGSQISVHQRNSLWHMVTSDYVKPGGLFVIADIAASSCHNYVAGDPRHLTKCLKFSCHQVNARMTGGTSGCIILTNGRPSFLATLELAELTDGTGQVAC